MNGGFGRAASLSADEIRTQEKEPVATLESEAVAHINTDHPDVPPLLASIAEPAGDRGGGQWRAIGLDPEGIDLGNGSAILRLAFPRPVTNGTELRQTLIELTARARATDDP